MATFKRPSLGQRAKLGTLYDARRDAFLTESLMTGDIPEDAVTSVPLDQSKSSVGTSASLKEKFEKLGIGNELITSFLAGMVEPKGSAKYLTQKRDALPVVQRALYHTVTMRQETIDFSKSSLTSLLDLSSLSACSATHVVSGITWGGRTIVAARQYLPPGADRAKYEAKMDEAFQQFDEMQLPPSKEVNRFEDGSEAETNIKIYSDFPDADDDSPETLKHAFRQAWELRMRTESVAGGKGKPLIYTLLPINFLVMLGAIIPDDTNISHLSAECTEKYVNLLDDLSMAQQSVTAYHRTLKAHSSVVRAEHIMEVQAQLLLIQKGESDLTSNFARLVAEVRSGRASSYRVWQLVEDFLAGETTPAKLLSTTDEYAEKLEFISMAVNLGAQYLSITGKATQAVSGSIPKRGTSYVFFFNNQVMNAGEMWEEHVCLLRELLDERPRTQSIIIADCWSDDDPLSQALISVYFNGELKTKDLLTDRKALANKHLIKFMNSEVEKVVDIPSQRRAVVLPCPHPYCDPQANCEWTCFECHVAMEYSPTTGYFYCECGKIPVDAARFICRGPEHGSEYARYPPRKLGRLLQSLPPASEMNILILGESGIGKSTFINAFVNYLTFSTLDEGLEAARLNWIIPCSFKTQATDVKTRRLISKTVKIGSDSNEHDGSVGSSATQQATVYPIYVSGTLVRLIDTPGIGDTRGPEQDKHNLANVLSVLRNYSELHGILILLKPNMPRLNVMFRFCVKELLSSLHRSAARNIAFGFTNSRGADYTAGDTFGPLEELLSEYNDVIPGLFDYNMYYFDSESFRYLAAQKRGIDLGTIEDYRRSWDQSTKETDRLMAYFRSLVPHHTQETLNMNETRHLIIQLTAPMQQISQAITDSIAKSEEQAQALSDTELAGKELMAKLHIQKSVVTAASLKQPKTVCSHETCVTPVQDTNLGTVLLRKSLCHNPCYLTEVPVSVKGTKKLAGCAAFSGGGTCTRCRHVWEDHEHIMVEYSLTSETTTDPQVQAALNDNGNLVTAKEAQIKALKKHISELKSEHQTIQEAAAKFSIYMKKNSITHYNDATIEYMEQLIKDERSKLRARENRACLDRLERNLAQYEAYVATMEAGKSTSRKNSVATLDEKGAALLVQQLYNLKHYGQMLKDISKVVSNAYAANFRERPYRIQGKRFWMETPRDNDQSPVLWIPKRQSFRQSMLLDVDGQPVAASSSNTRFKGLVSRLRKSAFETDPEEDNLGGPSSHLSYTSNNWPSFGEQKKIPPVRSIADLIDDETAEQDEGSVLQKGHLDEQSTGFARPIRPSGIPNRGPPPYDEVTDFLGNDALVNGSAARKLKTWSRVKNKFRASLNLRSGQQSYIH